MVAYAAVCSVMVALQVSLARATLPASVGTAPSFNIPILAEEPGTLKAPMKLMVVSVH